MLLKDAVRTYLSGLKLSGGGDHQEQAKICLNRAVDWWSRDHGEDFKAVSELTDLRAQAITEFLAHRKNCPGRRPGEKLSQFTLAKEARYIRCFLSAVREDPVTYDVTSEFIFPKIPRVKTPKIIPKALEEPDLNQVFGACQHARYPVLTGLTAPQWWFTLLYLVYLTCMRRRAIFNTPRPPDIELERGMLFLPASANKVGMDMYFPLTPQACQLIRNLPAKPGEPMFVWVGKRGSTNFRSFYHHYSEIQTKAGIEGLSQSRLHTLRKTGLTYMARSGVEMKTVQEHAGHSSIVTTATFYVGVLGESRKDAVKALPVPEAARNLNSKQKKLFD